MITHQNHKFIYNEIASFELPNGMCINYDCEAMSQDNFELIAPDGSFRFVIEFFTSSKNARELIEELNDPSEHDVLSPPCAITTPTGLNGFTITYWAGKELYEEYTLDLSDNERCNFWLMCQINKFLERDFHERVKAEFLANLKPTEGH